MFHLKLAVRCLLAPAPHSTTPVRYRSPRALFHWTRTAATNTKFYAAAIVALGIALLAGAHWCAAARAKLCHARYAAASTFLRLPPSNRFRGVLHSGWVLCPSFAVVRQQHHGVLGIGPPAYGLMAVRFFCLPPNRFPPRQNGYAAQPALSTPDAGVSGDNAMVSVNDEDC